MSIGSGDALDNWNYNTLFGDMMIESQDVDMSLLGLDMMPWFDSYQSHGFTELFGNVSQASPATISGAATSGAEQGTPLG